MQTQTGARTYGERTPRHVEVQRRWELATVALSRRNDRPGGCWPDYGFAGALVAAEQYGRGEDDAAD